MKNFLYLFLPLIFLCSCPDDTSDNMGENQEPENLENTFSFNIDGESETLSFDCTNSPSLYAFQIVNFPSFDKFLFNQGYNALPFSVDKELIYQIIIYTEHNIRGWGSEELIALITENPDLVTLEVTLNEEGSVFKNQFVDFGSLNGGYEERNIVAENEMFNFTLGEINTFECQDNIETIALSVQYSAIIKTEDGSN